MELNDVIKELEELKTRVSELENRITKEEVPDILDWANWVATDEIGEIWAYTDRPIRDIKSRKTWVSFDAYMEHITPEQAIALCGRLPQWSDDEPTPVKR